MNHPLIHLSNRGGQEAKGGVVAVCSAHPQVLRSAMASAVAAGAFILFEATANQVNLSGGYSGMTPDKFVGI